jgi:hypothetical protein
LGVLRLMRANALYSQIQGESRMTQSSLAAGIRAAAGCRAGALRGWSLREYAGKGREWLASPHVRSGWIVRLAAQGASLCGMIPVLRELAVMLGFRDRGVQEFTGPARGSGAEPDLLYRGAGAWRC